MQPRASLAGGPPVRTPSWRLWAAAALLCLVVIAASWPGALIGDSILQRMEIRAGRITDWHPPLMSIVWRALGGLPQAMLILNSIIYWTGIALLADQLQRQAGRRWGLAMLAVGLSPISIFYLGRIQKDTLLTALLVLAAGLTARFARGYGLVPAVIGVLTRINGAFAAAPFFLRTRRLGPAVLASLALAAALIPASVFVNRAIFGAERSHVEKTLQLFDLAGTGDPELKRCYSVFEWDTLKYRCQAFDRTPDDITGRWLGAIAAHPLSYAAHRLSFFNHAIYFLVPPRQECVLIPDLEDSCASPGRHPLLVDALARNPFFWPVTWLIAGALLLFVRPEPLARMLALSGLLYGGAYLFVGVAVGFRYFYWTELAVQIALVWQLAHGLPRWRLILFPVLAAWIVGYAWRYAPLLF
ncbi:MAG: hypothetical protein V4513_01455 [Pseudomonadota bacterium]